MQFTLNIDFDRDTESPCEYSCWKLISFNRKHINFIHPDEFNTIGIKSKLKHKTAFILSYYEHGDCLWSLSGEGPKCRWDSCEYAGILLLDNPKEILVEKRLESARGFLKEYNEWANGHCYCYSIVDENDEVIESCGGFIGEELLCSELEPIISKLDTENNVVVYAGEANWIRVTTN